VSTRGKTKKTRVSYPKQPQQMNPVELKRVKFCHKAIQLQLHLLSITLLQNEKSIRNKQNNTGNMITSVVNCKAMAGRRQNCQVHAGRSEKICEEILGRNTSFATTNMPIFDGYFFLAFSKNSSYFCSVVLCRQGQGKSGQKGTSGRAPSRTL
jgi:hypothetical protein